MDFREAKGLELAARAKIVWDDGAWLVPSQSTTGTYRVLIWPGAESCPCEDFGLTAKPCKHIIAARLVEDREGRTPAPPIDTDILPIRKTYTQDWPAYNKAQAVEKDRFQILLHDLCRDLAEPERKPTPGPKPHLVRDSIFGMAFKVYCTMSGRRFSCDLKEAHKRGYTSKPIPGMKTTAFMENPAFTPILKCLIAESARPLKAVEQDFAIDSTGFSTSRFESYYDNKYGVTRRKCLWVKAHVAVGTKTNVITAVRILDKDAADSPQFGPLTRDTAANFDIKEMSADKAYSSVEAFEQVAGLGGTAYIPFKSNATGGAGGLFEKMFHYFQFRRDEFLQHYHRRSNVESTFSGLKRLFGDSVRSKTDTAMVNEVLCKMLAWNLVCLIHEQCELGIDPVFWGEKSAPVPDTQSARLQRINMV